MTFILRAICAVFLAVCMVALPKAAEAQPAFSKVFSPNSIGPGGTSTLTFTINNSGGGPVTDLDFTDVLPTVPGDMDIADPANASTTCADGVVTAPAGGGSISLSGGRLGAGAICTVSVDVTASTPGAHTNTTGDLTSSVGNSGTATDDLTVNASVPGFTKAAAPNPTNVNDPFTLTYTIDNTANTSDIGSLSFSETFPGGITVAPLPHLTTDCGDPVLPPTLTAAAGGSSLSLFANGFLPTFPALAAGASCTVSVDLVAGQFGSFNLVSGDLTVVGLSAGKASTSVMVSAPSTTGPTLIKRFTPGVSGPGGTVQLIFEMTNTARAAATAIAFTDDLDAFLTGAVSTSGTVSGCGGTISGTDLLSFSGGSLASGESCSFSVDVTIPGTASASTYTNTTSTLTALVDGSPFVGAVASDTLDITAGTPLDLDISFLTNPVEAGGSTILRYTVTNPNPTVAASGAMFEHIFNGFGAGVAASATPASESCGVGSSVTFTPGFNPPTPCDPCSGIPARLDLTDGLIPPGGMCTFDLTLTVPADLAGGSYPTETTNIISSGGTGAKGSDTLSVNGGVNVNFTKAFTDDPVVAGNPATLEFTISNAAESSGDATAISFTDDLTGMGLAGLTANLPSSPDPACGVGSVLTGSAGDTLLTFTGGTLAPGASCTFSVTLNVSIAAATGNHVNTTSGLSFTGAGLALTAPAASDTLSVQAATAQPLIFSKAFPDNPGLPGGIARVVYTIENPNPPGSDAANISFTDNWGTALSGLGATGAPTANTCGGTHSFVIPNTFVLYSGGTVPAAATCTIEFNLQIPGGAASSTYNSESSTLSYTLDGSPGPATTTARADLVVETVQLEFIKNLPATSVAGDLPPLEFIITNPTGATVTDIGFTDDLDAMLSGTVTSLAISNTCGGMATSGLGASTFSYAGGTLTAGASCTIIIRVVIPLAVTTGDYTNTVDDLSGNVGAAVITGPTASDTMRVFELDAPFFSKDFTAVSRLPGETTDLIFRIENFSTTSTLDALSFSDDLTAFMPDIATTGAPISGCGGTLTGTNVLSFTGGSLAPSSSCEITVPLTIPLTATGGLYTNTSSGLFSNGLSVAPAAGASLTIVEAVDLSVTLDDAPDPIFPTETLTYTVDVANAGPSTAPGVVSTLTLPAGVTLVSTSGCAEDPNGVPGCTLGDIVSGGSASYTVTTTVDAATIGTMNASVSVATATFDTNNTNNSANADTTVSPSADISVAKDDGVSSVQAGNSVVYTIIAANAGPSTDPAVTLTDVLPAALSCTYTSVASGGASGNTAAGSGDLAETLSMPAGSQVTYSATCLVDVMSTGTLINTATAAASVNDPDTANNSATDTDTITDGPVPGFAKVFAPNAISQGEETVLTFTIDNSTSTLDANAMAFTDDFPGDMAVAAVPGVANTCGGTFAANAGDTSISLASGALPAGASCTISVAVTATTTGVLTNATSDLTSTLNTAAPATADLTVGAALAPGFAKAFAPTVINQGETSILSFTIDNSANAIEATDLAFSDSFPAGMVVAGVPGVSNGCGGTFVANGGDTLISLTGGTLAAGASCTIDVSVQGLTVGAHDNVSSVLSSSLAEAPAASATLTVNALPLSVGMSFVPGTIEQFLTTTLTYSLSNGAAIAATSVSLSDTLPAGVTLASPAVATTTCGGGTLSAPDGGDAVSYTGGTVAAGGTCAVSVAVTSGTVGSFANSTEAVSSSLGTSAAASATLVVEPATTGTLTIVQNTDTDGAYVFSSAAAALNFTINTAGGTGQQGPITLTAGSYVISQATPDGVGNTAITCTDSDSSGQPRERRLTVNIDALEAVTCTFTSISSRQKTVDTINRFLTKRADLILSSEPSSGRRIDRLKRGAGGSTSLSFANGDLNSFVPFTAQLSPASDSYSLSTSFLQMREAAASLALAHGDQRGIRHIPNYRWDAWFEAQYKKFDAGADSGHFAIAYFGADYLVTPDLLIGAMIQIDDMEDNSASLNSSVDGTGWMAGPYITARLAPNLYFDGRIAAGQSSNDISPFNTYVDEFDTDRWMAMAGLTGDFQRGNWSIQPGASLSYFEETQHSYVDGIGVVIPSQTISLGQIKIGPTFTGQFQTKDGMSYSPYMSLDAIYNFGDTKGVTVTNADTASTDGWRGRVQGGVDFRLQNGTSISLGGTYDGIFRNQLDVWGLSFELNIPIQKPAAH